MRKIIKKKNSEIKNGPDIILRISLILFVLSIVFNSIIYSFLGWNVVFFVRILSIILSIFYRIASKKFKINSKYAFLLLVIMMPFFFNNAYIEDGSLKPIMDYFLAFLYAIAVSNLEINKKHVMDYLLRYFYYFAIVTAVFTLISLIMPRLYLDITKYLFSPEIYTEIYYGVRMQSLYGLTSHYSYNAFYMVIGLIYVIFSDELGAKKRIISLILFSICMLLIGKRGHLLFFVISLLIGYVFIKKISVKTIAKLLMIGVSLVMIVVAVISFIPQANRTFERITTPDGNSNDLSSGRFQMYDDIRIQYDSNEKKPLGWGQYAKSTGYFHPGLHNDYLQLYYEVGVIGSMLVLLPNLYFLIRAFVVCRSYATPEAKMTLIYNIFFNLYAITGLPRYDMEPYTVYFILNAYLFVNMPLAKVKKQ